jgi:hypothetical protein
MIFNRNLLFLHPPKTAGMSTSLYLLQVLSAPVYVSQPVRDEALPAGVVQLLGKRHETLAECREVVARHGFDLRRFPIVLATIRNPYDLEVSRWAFLRQAHPWERGPEQDLALACDFDEFAVRNEQRGGSWATDALAPLGLDPFDDVSDGRPYPNELKDFFTLDGRIPDNLRIIRFECLVPDLHAALASVGVDGRAVDFPWINTSRRAPYPAYYTRQAEEAVYRRYRWAFDEGFYLRFDPDAPLRVAEPPPADRISAEAWAAGGTP